MTSQAGAGFRKRPNLSHDRSMARSIGQIDGQAPKEVVWVKRGDGGPLWMELAPASSTFSDQRSE